MAGRILLKNLKNDPRPVTSRFLHDILVFDPGKNKVILDKFTAKRGCGLLLWSTLNLK